MKKTAFILIAALGFMACNSPAKGPNGITYKTPVQYNDYIIGKQTTLLEKIMKFSNVAKYNLDSADKLLDKYADESDDMIKDIKGMPPFRKDTAFRQAAVNSFMFYKKAFSVYYKDMIRIRREMPDDEEEKLNEIIETLTKEEEKFDNAFHNAQRNFASKNNMRLTENKMQQQIDEVNK